MVLVAVLVLISMPVVLAVIEAVLYHVGIATTAPSCPRAEQREYVLYVPQHLRPRHGRRRS